MVSADTILKQIGEQVTDQLISDIESKKITKYGAVNASGQLRDSVRYEVKDGTLTVYAADYIYYLQYGRKPFQTSSNGQVSAGGKFPPRSAIIDWIKAKGIISDIKIESLAYLIQRKIATKGTTVFEQGGSDILSSIFNDSLVEEVRKKLIDNFTNNVIESFRSEVLMAA